MPSDAFSTDVLDRAVQREREAREKVRLDMLHRIDAAILSAPCSVGDVYLFGSVVVPGRFRDSSDVDIAIHGIEPRAYFDLKTHLEGRLEREVDLVELERCRFSDSILRKGVLWRHPHSPSSPRK